MKKPGNDDTRGVSIPVTFEFHPQSRRWVVGSADVAGWYDVLMRRAWKAKEEADRITLEAFGLPASPRFPSLGTFPTTISQLQDVHPNEEVALSVRIPRDSSAPISRFYEHLLRGDQGGADQTQFHNTMRQSKIPILPSGLSSETHPDLTIQSFEILVSVSVPEVSTAKRRGKAMGRKMRAEFFNLERENNVQLANFLTKWGVWGGEFELWEGAFDSTSRRQKRFASLTPYASEAIALFPETIWLFHDIVREGAREGPAKWFSQTLPHRIGDVSRSLFTGASVRLRKPYFVVSHQFCRDAIVDEVTIDQLRGITQYFCENKNCGRMFLRKSNHGQRFCSVNCGTSSRVDRLRKKRAKVPSVKLK